MARTFDAIVIGSGLGGLTAAALCARGGRRVLVLERNETFGGAATVYRHRGLAIESSLHEIDGFDEDDPKLPLLRALGLDQELRFVDVGDLYEVRGALIGEPFVLPHGAEAALEAATARFPEHEAGLAAYFRRLTALRGVASFATRHQDDRMWWLTHAPEAVRRLWPLLRDGNATVGEILSELFGAHEAVKAALAANLCYYHDDPDRMQFLHFAVAQASYVLGGGHYVRGGSQALTDRLVVPRSTVDWDTSQADDFRDRGARWTRIRRRESDRALRSDRKSLAQRRPGAGAGCRGSGRQRRCCGCCGVRTWRRCRGAWG